MEKFGLTAEQASKVVTDDGATDYEVLGQIFADSKKRLLPNMRNRNLTIRLIRVVLQVEAEKKKQTLKNL